jgi:hypothetical protein
MSVLYTCTIDRFGKYDLAKFEDGLQPDSVYYVERLQQGALVCNCPASVHHSTCKHTKILENFLKGNKENRGYFYDHEKNEFSRLFGADLLED